MSDPLLRLVPESWRKWFDEKVSPWFGAIFLAAVIQWGVGLATRVHRGLGFALTLICGIWLLALLLGFRRRLYNRKYSRTMLGALWLFTLLGAIVVFSSASVLIVGGDPAAYTGPAPIDRDAFMNFYFWHAIDAIPGLDLWGSFGVPPPSHQQHGFLAGICLLAFRAGVLATLISTVRDWLGHSERATGPEGAHRAES